MALDFHLEVSLICGFARPGGSGLLTISRCDDFELYRPTRREGLTPQRLLKRASHHQERLFYIDVAGSSQTPNPEP